MNENILFYLGIDYIFLNLGSRSFFRVRASWIDSKIDMKWKWIIQNVQSFQEKYLICFSRLKCIYNPKFANLNIQDHSANLKVWTSVKIFLYTKSSS